LPRAAAILLPFAILGIAAAGIFVRLADPAPPVVVGFYRMAFAGIGLAIGILATGTRIQWRGRGAGFALLAGLCFGADLGFWQTSVTLTTVATATLLVNVTPIHVGLYTVLVRRERLEPRFVAGAGLALLGTLALLGVPSGGVDDVRGAALALTASLFYAGYIVSMAEARQTIDVASGLALTTLGSATVLGASALLRGDALLGFPLHSWAAMAGAAALSQLVGVLGIVWALRFLPATLTSVALLGQPVAAALLAWWILAEPVGPAQALGGIAVLAGIALASSAYRRG
jgi:drug/metabolite transporter (DMT)-like permease